MRIKFTSKTLGILFINVDESQVLKTLEALTILGLEPEVQMGEGT